ncbi:MAG TPA: periplasmic heavy metal sensor [Thermodesulfovibrionales bacterium]|nr:periplasmic heavy metal sensor [Thermodesulfovibrionales bacterium]
MKKLVFISVILFVFTISAYAQMGMMGSQQGGQMGQGMMGEMPMMNCPMQQMQGQGMMQGGQPMMEQGMMGGMMGMGRKCMGRFNPWFQYGVTLILENSAKLELRDGQKDKLDNTRRKYTKDIIRQDAEIRVAEIDLEALLKKPEINLSEIKEVLKKIGNMETQVEYLRIEAFTEARKILTDDQRKKLKKLMEMPAPMMRGMMGGPPVEPQKEEQEKEGLQEEGVPKTDPHGH